MRMRDSLAVAIAIALITSPLTAQQHDHAGGAVEAASSMHVGQATMCMGMMDGGMGMGPLPSMLLGARDALGLTDQQANALSELELSFDLERGEHVARYMQEQRAAQDALADDDLAVYESRLRAAADHMVQAQVAMAEVSQQARSLLSSEQIDQVDRSMDMTGRMMGTMGQMMQGGMMGRMGRVRSEAGH